MRIPALTLTLLGVVSTLLGHADAAADLYRGDSRGPKVIRAEKPSGFKARAYGRDSSKQGTLRAHVTNIFTGSLQDAYISTTPDISVAKDFASKTPGKYLYHLDSSKIADKTNVADWYAEQNLKNPYEKEKEVAVKNIIPWAAVTKVEREVNGVWKTVKLDDPESDPKPKPGPSDPKPKPGLSDPESKPGPSNPESKPETKPETKPDTKPGTKPNTKPETKPDTKPGTKPNTKPETKPEPKPKPGSKIPVPVTKPGKKPGKKGGKRHARDFSLDDDSDINVEVEDSENDGQIFDDAEEIYE
jgi:hypothetical protein